MPIRDAMIVTIQALLIAAILVIGLVVACLDADPPCDPRMTACE